MARRESDREDLMAEATALRQRVELEVPGEDEPVVAGIRDGGALSVYFGPDPVYHFDPMGRLRRGYVGGSLFRTEGSTLARLQRQRDGTNVQLLRRDLSPNELAEFLACMTGRLARLCTALEEGEARLRQEIPADGATVAALREKLSSVLNAGGELAPAIVAGR